MGLILCPSMMCADYSNLEKEVDRLQDAGADILHLDVMDGRFVPNFGMGLQDIEYICKHSFVKTEIHLMIERPEDYIYKFIDMGADIIYIHPESDYHPMTVLQKIVEAGIEAGIVLNPGTSVETVLELLQVVKKVLVMGVNPGHAGQMYIPYVEKKIEKLLSLCEEYGFSIGMDGACTAERIERLYSKGVSHFVLGTAALFKVGTSYEEVFKELREIEKRSNRQ